MFDYLIRVLLKGKLLMEELIDVLDENGNKTGEVTKYDNSMYAGTEYKSTKNAYNTIYLRFLLSFLNLLFCE